MNYSRVALLLTLVLVGRMADAWMIDSQLIGTGERMVGQKSSTTESLLLADAFRHSLCRYGNQLSEGDGFPYAPQFVNNLDGHRFGMIVGNCGVSANEPSLRAKIASFGKQLASPYCRGALLLKAGAGKAMAQSLRYWRETVACGRDPSPKAEEVGLLPLGSLGTTAPFATIKDFARAMSQRCPAEQLQAVSDRFSCLDPINSTLLGSWSNHIDYAKPQISAMHYGRTDDKTLSAFRWMSTWLTRSAERSLETWKVALCNTSLRFAQLDWTILLDSRVADRAAGAAMPASKVMGR
jgi:hypothetical protein